jgi:hypothetical protein
MAIWQPQIVCQRGFHDRLHGSSNNLNAPRLDVTVVTSRILKFAEPFCFRRDLSSEQDALWGDRK